MKSLKRNQQSLAGVVLMISCLTLTGLTLSGCESVRKKFVRKKKSDRNQKMPIFETIDYAEYTQSPEMKYKHYYSLWVVWYKELDNVLFDDVTEKKFEYITNQIKSSLMKMAEVLDESYQDTIDQEMTVITGIQKDLMKSESLRNLPSIQARLRRHEKKIRRHLSFAAVFASNDG